MRRHASAVRGDIERRLEEARANRRLWIVGLIAFTGVFREGAETVLFLWGTAGRSRQRASGDAGGALGVAVAAVLGWLIFHGGRRISLRLFFAATSALLLLIAAGLFSTGLGKLQAFGWLPGGDPLRDTSSVLSDQGVVGGMLGGLVGYRARPCGGRGRGPGLLDLLARRLARLPRRGRWGSRAAADDDRVTRQAVAGGGPRARPVLLEVAARLELAGQRVARPRARRAGRPRSSRRDRCRCPRPSPGRGRPGPRW